MTGTQTYLLLRFGDRGKLPSALEQIQRLDGVHQCTAVDGHYSLIIETADSSRKIAEALTQLDGFSGLQRCELIAVEKDGAVSDESLRYGYVFLEADMEGLDRLLEIIRDHSNVDLLLRTKGDYNIVAKLHGKDFDEIDRLVSNEFEMFDGVLRLKSDRIIDLDKM